MCDLLIDGLCSNDGSATASSGAGLVATTGLVAGSQTISAGKILLEDGTGLLDEDGSSIVQEAVGSESDILTEDGGKMLDESGGKILNEQSSPSGTGSAPLMYVSTPCQYVVVAAKSSNTGTIWIGGSDVEIGIGIPLIVGEDNTSFPIDDLSKVFITGNVGDGVTFVYGTAPSAVASGSLRDDSGNLIKDDSGNQITG